MPKLRTALVFSLGIACALPACAHRTDEAMRRAWEKSAGRGTRQAGSETDPEAVNENGNGSRTSVAHGWARVDELLGGAIELLAIGPDETRVARLAERWCTIEPVPEMTAHGPVHLCHPSPPVSVEGHTLVLEMGGPGVIGLVARDLTELQSHALMERARTAATHLCTGPWEPAPVVTARDGALREEFHTCSARGGPMLTVGRYRVRGEADDDNRMERGGNVWQVSVAVLGTT